MINKLENKQNQSSIINLTSDNIGLACVSIKKKLILVSFGSPWCGACKRQERMLEKLLPELADNILFCRIDVDKYEQVAGRFKVQKIPSIVIFSQGKKIKRIMGVKISQDLRRLLYKQLTKIRPSILNRLFS